MLAVGLRLLLASSLLFLGTLPTSRCDSDATLRESGAGSLTGHVNDALAGGTALPLATRCSGRGHFDQDHGICRCPSGWGGRDCEVVLLHPALGARSRGSAPGVKAPPGGIPERILSTLAAPAEQAAGKTVTGDGEARVTASDDVPAVAEGGRDADSEGSDQPLAESTGGLFVGGSKSNHRHNASTAAANMDLHHQGSAAVRQTYRGAWWKEAWVLVFGISYCVSLAFFVSCYMWFCDTSD